MVLRHQNGLTQKVMQLDYSSFEITRYDGVLQIDMTHGPRKKYPEIVC